MKNVTQHIFTGNNKIRYFTWRMSNMPIMHEVKFKLFNDFDNRYEKTHRYEEEVEQSSDVIIPDCQ